MSKSKQNPALFPVAWANVCRHRQDFLLREECLLLLGSSRYNTVHMDCKLKYLLADPFQENSPNSSSKRTIQ